MAVVALLMVAGPRIQYRKISAGLEGIVEALPAGKIKHFAFQTFCVISNLRDAVIYKRFLLSAGRVQIPKQEGGDSVCQAVVGNIRLYNLKESSEFRDYSRSVIL
jgi:hypothetical protein